MHIGIVGSDDYEEFRPFIGLLQELKRADSQLVVCITDGEGFAAGVFRECNRLGIATQTFYTDRTQYGKGATFKRNYFLAHAVDTLHAYWQGKSFGCGHIIGQAKAAGKRVIIHRHGRPDEIFDARTSFDKKLVEAKAVSEKPKGKQVGTDEFGDPIYK